MGWQDERPFVPDLPNLDPPPSFELQEQALAWVSGEFECWEWLWSAPSNSGSLNGGNYTNQRNLLQGLKSTLSSDVDLATQRQNLRNSFQHAFHPAQGHSVLPSKSETGARILSIQEALGPDAGRWAYQLYARNFPIAQVQQASDLRHYLAAATFDESVFGELGETLKEERTRYRSEISKLQNNLRKLEAERLRERAEDAALVRKGTRRLLRQTKAVWKNATVQSGTSLEKALSSIAETEDYFRNQMALLAPVGYWKGKAKSHGRSEMLYGAVCIIFFMAAAYIIYRTASGTIAFLETLGDEGRASAYFITAGALLGGTTLLFWIGRVLVKLFLSEHHLRSECEEKAIMTQAFLSMETNETNFGETERAIVLASIFKSSPDGIVKDEGPSDLAGTAILAKLLSK